MIRNLTAILAVLAPFTADAADLHVGNGQSYQTVQAAVDAGADFDTIVVHAGTYEGAVQVPSRYSHLSIKAYGTDAVTLRASSTQVTTVTANSTHLRLQGLRLEAAQGENKNTLAVVNSTNQNDGYFAVILCDTELVGNTSNSDVGVRAVNSANAKIGVTWFSETLTGLNATSAGPLTNIWEDDMPYGIWEDDMPYGIWEDDMPYGIWEDDMPYGLCQF